MNTNGFITQVQSLRELIANNHSYDPYTAATNYRSDEKAIRKFQWQCGQVFGKDREERIKALGLLVGRKISSSVGRQGLTLGELYALLTWFGDDEEWFPLPNPDAEDVLLKLKDNPQEWGPVIHRYLEPATIPVAVRYDDGQGETSPF